MRYVGLSEFDPSKFKTAREWHQYLVLNDPEFQKDLKHYLDSYSDAETMSVQAKSKHLEIAEAYDLSVQELFLLMDDKIEAPRKWIVSKRNKYRWIVYINTNITKEEILDLWQAMHKEAPKRPLKKPKAPFNPDLIYAISRLRKRNITFKEIYKIYLNGSIPGYKGSKKQYDEVTLERYFRKYNPKKEKDDLVWWEAADS